MALDRALLESVRAGRPPVVRFYRWSPPCLSLGRNQPAAGAYDPERIRALAIDVVRRPTGGRAVLHDRELTYSVVVPDGRLGRPREVYAAINRALLAGLRRLGVPASLRLPGGGPAPVPSLAPCFRDPAPGEVMLGSRKLVGSAQLREGGVILQHGSLLLADDQFRVAELLGRPAEPGDAPATLADHFAQLPSWTALVAALAAGFREQLGTPLEPGEPLPGERDRAAALQRHFADPAWTWRR